MPEGFLEARNEPAVQAGLFGRCRQGKGNVGFFGPGGVLKAERRQGEVSAMRSRGSRADWAGRRVGQDRAHGITEFGAFAKGRRA